MSETDWSARTWSSPLADPRYREDVRGRIQRAVRKTEAGCWEWQGYRTPDGYGKVSVKRRMIGAHQVSLAIHRGGLWPAELQVDHLCRNRACCNPAHLDLVTPHENTIRGLGPVRLVERQTGKTHCPQGHPYSPENTKIERGGSRKCRICIRARVKAYRDSRSPLAPGDPRHGSPFGYNTFGCRCEACRSAATASARRWRQAMRAENPLPPRLAVTHCRRGHEFTEANTIVRKSGKRLCRSCRNETQRQYRAGRGAT